MLLSVLVFTGENFERNYFNCGKYKQEKILLQSSSIHLYQTIQ